MQFGFLSGVLLSSRVSDMKRIWGDMPSVTQNSLYWTVTFAVALLFFTVSAMEECKKINSCQCQFRNGSMINLESLGSHGTARWQNKMASKNDSCTYFYNPCFEFKLPESSTTSECASGVAACKVCKDDHYYSLGTQQSAEFVWDPVEKLLHLFYFSAGNPNRTTNVTLICDAHPEADDSLSVVGNISETVYEMTLRSRCACADLCGPHSGLSGGSLLIILFSVFIILYLLFGIVFNKLTRGAQGWELIPNYEFWQDFPLLVRDGCVYVASGCKPDTTYERI